MAQLGEDKRQIGLTSAGQTALGVLMADERFAAETDAYKFGISYAIAAGLDPDEAPTGGYITKYNAIGGIDIDGVIRDLIDVLAVGDPGRPYATAEKLAELGITAVAKRLHGNESLAEIMADVSE
jgi:hypothetical protein